MRWIILLLGLSACGSVDPNQFNAECDRFAESLRPQIERTIQNENNHSFFVRMHRDACIRDRVFTSTQNRNEQFALTTGLVLGGAADGLEVNNYRNAVREEVRYWQRNPIR